MGLVQSKQGHSTSSPLAITLDSATTAGNGLIVVVGSTGSTNDGTVSGITLGGAAGNFASVASSGSPAADAAVMDCWLDLNCAGGQTAISISFTGAVGTTDFYAAVYERDDLLSASAFDKSSGNPVNGSSSSWTSNATATTTQATEVWAGGVLLVGASALTATGPSSPWANLTALSNVNGSVQTAWVSGWEAVTSTGTATYSGTVSPAASVGYTALAVTLKASPPSRAGSAAARPGRAWLRRFRHRQQPQAPFQAPPRYPFPPAAVPGQTWQRRFRHRQAYPYPAPAATPVALADSGAGADTFSAGNVSTPLPALAGRTWLRWFRHRQAPVSTSTFSVAFTDSGAAADSLSAGNVSTPLPAVAGKTWRRQFDHRQQPVYTSTFSEDFSDSGSGTDTLAPGIATAYPFPPATPGRTWQRRFRHAQTYPYLPVPANTFNIGLTDTGTGADAFAASILTQLPLPPAAPGQTWKRQYKHRQQPLCTSAYSVGLSDSGSGTDAFASSILTPVPLTLRAGQTWLRQYKHRQIPLCTSTFSRDLADTGSGTDVLALSVITANPVPLPAAPGRTWQRRYKHRQQHLRPFLAPPPFTIGVLTAATASGGGTTATAAAAGTTATSTGSRSTSTGGTATLTATDSRGGPA